MYTPCAGLYTSESGDGKVSAQPWGISKVRTADGTANGKKGESSWTTCIGKYNEWSKKQMEFVNRAFDAALNIRRSAVLEKIPPEST